MFSATFHLDFDPRRHFVRAAGQNSQLEKVGKELRNMMPFINPKEAPAAEFTSNR